MEIKIDTKKDSVKEIQHMIDFLTRFISAQDSGMSDQQQPTEPVSDGLFGIFGADSSSDIAQKPIEPQAETEFNLEPY